MMNHLINGAWTSLKKHKWAICFSILVGLLSVAPHIISMYMLGNSYRGIPFLYSDNEDYYIARIHEIIDGHYLVGSPYFFEYKDMLPTAPPIGEYFYVVLSLLFHISITTVVVFAKFLFPAILFFLVYTFIRIVSDNTTGEKNILGAITGGLFITLGFGLIDYQHVFHRIIYGTNWPALSLWVRPVNPITGALLLFATLPLVWQSLKKASWWYPIFGGIMLSLTFGYIFTFGIICSIIGVLIVLSLSQKKFTEIKKLISIIVTAITIDGLYLIQIIPSLTQGDGTMAGRSGLMLTHAPLLNKVLLVATTLFFLLIMFVKKRSGVNIIKEPEKYRAIWFSFSLLLGSFLALNQQVLTGRTVWPYHFVQYSIPLAIVAILISLFVLLRPLYPRLWRCGMYTISTISLLFAVWNAGTYIYAQKDFVTLQEFAPIFNWLNKNATKDCVVLVAEDENARLAGLIPAFTSCNVYFTANLSGLYPMERIEHDFFVELRLRGVATSSALSYLTENEQVVRKYFYKDWFELLHLNDDQRIASTFPELTRKYSDFMKHDFTEELRHYKIDYIVSRGPLALSVMNDLPGLHQEYTMGNMTVYTFK